MSDADLRHWLRFALVPGVGARRQLALLRGFGSPEAALFASAAALAPHLDAGLIPAFKQVAEGARDNEVERHLAWLGESGNGLVTLADGGYPRTLLDLPDAPTVLFCKGRIELLAATAVAIVGSRNATPQGLEHAAAFAESMSAGSLTVVSGLAAGIDAAAHRGALLGAGSTVAVVGTGLDRVYPAANKVLAHDIAERGLIVSEFVLGTPPKAEHFPRRNRLIAALARGTLVVEAALGSGSLITARQAADLGRDVFAIPGSIHSPVARGCHRLIKDGAKLVESAEDILSELGWSGGASPRREAGPMALLGDNERAVLDAAGYDPVDFDALIGRTGLTADALCAILLGLELAGAVTTLPGGRYQRQV